MPVGENGEGARGGLGSFTSDAGLTPRKGKRAGNEERWKEGELMYLKMQGNPRNF